jgi:hypothetical protein
MQMFNKLCSGKSIDDDIKKYKTTFNTNNNDEDDETYIIMNSPLFKTSDKSTKQLHNYFMNTHFYYMINELFKNMTSEQQKIVKKTFFKSIGLQHIKYENIDLNIYSTMVNQLNVEQNSGAGDCFFISLSDAINLYNSKFNNEKVGQRIIYNNYGKTTIFTQKSLRTLVANYIVKPENIDFYKTIGQINASSLNDLFKEQIQNVNNENYMDIIENIYTTNDNFLVKKPDTIPENKNAYDEPFSHQDNQEDIRKYVESSYYWADNTTIEIIIKELKINVIVIEYNKKEESLQMPFPNLKDTANNLKDMKDMKDIKDNDFNKYVFFYYENNHYELITFSNITSTGNIKKSIFDEDSPFIIPPIYILFLIFSVYYIQLSELDQHEIKLFSDFFEIFHEGFNTIYKKVMEKENMKSKFLKMFKTKESSKIRFLKYFNDYFNKNKNSLLNKEYPFLEKIDTIKNTNEVMKGVMKGGQIEKDKEDSMLSYYITIELELQKGETISKEQMKTIKCRQKWNTVRKAYSKFTRKKYIIPPVYDYTMQKNNKTLKK